MIHFGTDITLSFFLSWQHGTSNLEGCFCQMLRGLLDIFRMFERIICQSASIFVVIL